MKFLRLLTIPTIAILISAGCATRVQLKNLADEIKKEMAAQKAAMPEPTKPHDGVDASKFVTKDHLRRAINAHKGNWPHGCECK